MNKEKDQQTLKTGEEVIKIRKIGNSSRGLLIPAHWRKSFPELKREPLIFYAHLEWDGTGRLYIILKKARASPPPTINTQR